MLKKLSGLILFVTACSQPSNVLKVSGEKILIDAKSLLQAISWVDDKIVWVSGHEATFARSTDAGRTWEIFNHPSDTLQFRDLHAFDEDHVILMSAGTGASSQIIHYRIGSDTYHQVFQMPFEKGFLNTIEFWDDQKGLAFGDAIDNEYFVLYTQNGGDSWDRIAPEKFPRAGTGEGGFAASGTCISTLPAGQAWIATGAGGHSNILFTEDYGENWISTPGPLVTGDMAGIFSIRMKEQLGLIAGGNLAEPEMYSKNVAIMQNQEWKYVNQPNTAGVFYGSDLTKIGNRSFIILTGPKGMDYSSDLGNTWHTLDTTSYWAVDFNNSIGLAVGPEGNILRIEIK